MEVQQMKVQVKEEKAKRHVCNSLFFHHSLSYDIAVSVPALYFDLDQDEYLI